MGGEFGSSFGGDSFGGGSKKPARFPKSTPAPDLSQLTDTERAQAEAMQALEKVPADQRETAAKALGLQSETPTAELSMASPEYWGRVGKKIVEDVGNVPGAAIQFVGRLAADAPKAVDMWIHQPKLAADLFFSGLENTGTQIKDDYWQLVTNPKEALATRPLGAMLDASMVGGFLGKTLTGASKVLKGAEYLDAAESTAKTADAIAKYSQYLDPMKLTQEAVTQVMKRTPGLRNVYEGLQFSKIVGSSQRAGLRADLDIGPKLKQIGDEIGATADDYGKAVDAVEGFNTADMKERVNANILAFREAERAGFQGAKKTILQDIKHRARGITTETDVSEAAQTTASANSALEAAKIAASEAKTEAKTLSKAYQLKSVRTASIEETARIREVIAKRIDAVKARGAAAEEVIKARGKINSSVKRAIGQARKLDYTIKELHGVRKEVNEAVAKQFPGVFYGGKPAKGAVAAAGEKALKAAEQKGVYRQMLEHLKANLARTEKAASRLGPDADAVASAKQYLRNRKQAIAAGEATAEERALSSLTKSDFAQRESLTPVQQKLYDEIKRVGRVGAAQQIKRGAPVEFFEDVKDRQFAKHLGLTDSAEDIAKAKKVASDLGIDLEYYGHILPVSRARENLITLLSGKEATDILGQARIAAKPKLGAGFKAREGYGGAFLGSFAGEEAKVADRELATQAIDAATEVGKTAKGKTLKYTQDVIDTAKAYLAELDKRTRGFDVAYALEINAKMKAQSIAVADMYEKVGKTNGIPYTASVDDMMKLKSGEYKLLDVDAFMKNQGKIISAQQKGLEGLAKGESVEESVANVASDAYASTAEDVMKAGQTGSVLATGKGQYLIPTRVANNLMVELSKSTGWTGMTFFKMLDNVKQLMGITVLGLTPRYQVNNAVGNFLLSMVAVRNPMSYIRAFGSTFKDLVANETFQKTLTEMETEGNILKGVRELAANSRGPWFKKILSPILKMPVKGADIGMKLNQAVDNYFRRVIYLDEAVAMAKRRNMLTFGAGVNDVVNALKDIKASPELSAEVIDKIDNILPNYTALSPFERMYVRRIIPFYTFNRNMLLLGMKLPFEHPFRTRILTMAQGAFYDASVDPFVPDWVQLSVPVGFEPEKGNPIILNMTGMNPFNMYQSVMQGMARGNLLAVLKEFGEQMNPVLAVAVESFTGRETFTGRAYTGPFVTFDGKYLTQDSNGKVVEGVPPVPILDKFLQLFPQLNLLNPVVRAITGAPRPYANLKTGEVIEPYGGEVAHEAMKLGGFNFRVIDKESAQKAQELAHKLFSRMEIVNGIPQMVVDQDRLHQAMSILMRMEKGKKPRAVKEPAGTF